LSREQVKAKKQLVESMKGRNVTARVVDPIRVPKTTTPPMIGTSLPAEHETLAPASALPPAVVTATLTITPEGSIRAPASAPLPASTPTLSSLPTPASAPPPAVVTAVPVGTPEISTRIPTSTLTPAKVWSRRRRHNFREDDWLDDKLPVKRFKSYYNSSDEESSARKSSERSFKIRSSRAPVLMRSR
jgi:hypothetical protein